MTESDNRYDFVELNRTFHELSRYASESDEVDLSHVFHIGKRLSWTDLIREYRVVLLSEAGSGKTEEIRNIAQKLCCDGKAAFFIRLEHIPNDFEDAFEVGNFEQFQAWLASGEESWLFLDSVDEARLRSPGDFELAIRKLGRRISTAKDRTHIVIAGRALAWRPKTDLALCTRHLPFTLQVTKVATDGQTGKRATAIRQKALAQFSKTSGKIPRSSLSRLTICLQTRSRYSCAREVLMTLRHS